MSILLFANNANSTLNAPVSSVDLTATVAPGAGALFPNPGAGEYFLATIVDAATGLVNEIVKVTARSGDTMTIVRAQEGTTAHNWNSGDLFSNYWTAGSAQAMLQQAQAQQLAGAYAVDSGAVNVMTITLSPAPASLSALLGSPIRIMVAHTNTTATPTLNVNGLGAQNVVTTQNIGGTALGIGTAAIGKIITVVWDGSNFQYLDRVAIATLSQIQLGSDNVAPVTSFGLNIGFNASTPFGSGAGATDFQSFPNGLYIIWGNYTTVTGSTDLITLPVTLPNAMMSIAAVPANGSNVDVLAISPNPGAPNSQLIVADQRWTGATFTAQAGVLIRWIVIGY